MTLRRRSTSTKLNRFHIRMMLNYMDVDYKDQPRKTSECRNLLNAFRTEAAEKYNEAYKHCVLLEKVEVITPMSDPSTGEPLVVKGNHYSEWGEMVNDYFVDAEEKTLDRLENASMEIARDAIQKASEQFRTIAIQIGTGPKKAIEGIVPREFKKMCQLGEERRNILLVGPSGCGKTYLAGILAKALNLDFASQSCTEGMSESQLTGWLLPIGGSSEFVYVASEFVRIYENGGVFLLDELDAADANVLIIINQAIANEEFFLPQRYNNPRVIKHKDFVCIAAANTFGQGADTVYHGRNALDEATKDRFRLGTIYMDYCEQVEQSLCRNDVLSWGWDIRAKIVAHKLRRIMSTRVLKDASQMMNNQDWTLEDVKEAFFADWSAEEKLVVGETA